MRFRNGLSNEDRLKDQEQNAQQIGMKQKMSQTLLSMRKTTTKLEFILGFETIKLPITFLIKLWLSSRLPLWSPNLQMPLTIIFQVKTQFIKKL